MTNIKSGATADLLDINAASALKYTAYDPSGIDMNPVPYGTYSLPLGFRCSSDIAVTGYLWAMRNGNTKTIYITRIYLAAAVDTTAAIGTTPIDIGWVRFSTANPTGGTALTPIPKRSSYSASTVQDARICSGAASLGVTSIVFGTDYIASMPLSPQITTNRQRLDITYGQHPRKMLVLEADDGIMLIVGNGGNNLKAGCSFSGTVEWIEV